MSTHEDVAFSSRGYKLAGHLYPAAQGSADRGGAVIVIVHPWTATKEKSPTTYAKILSEAGFICLAYDAAYQGESEGEPRGLEDPYQRVEDIKSAVTYLAGLGSKGISPDKIGVLGICAGGAYAASAAQTDLRIKATATIAAICPGVLARRGFAKDSTDLCILQRRLEAAARDRTENNSNHDKVAVVHMLPHTAEQEPTDMPPSFRDQTTSPRSWDMMANFAAFAHNFLIAPRPLLMITGSEASTRWHSEYAITNAREPRELYIVEGLGHADLYESVDAGLKCVDFFGKYLEWNVVMPSLSNHGGDNLN